MRRFLTHCCYASLAFFAALLVCLVLLPPEILDLEAGNTDDCNDLDYDNFGEYHR